MVGDVCMYIYICILIGGEVERIDRIDRDSLRVMAAQDRRRQG